MENLNLKSKNYVSFRIYEFDYSHDELTRKLGIIPTEVRIKGKTRLVGQFNQCKILNRENVWILKSDLPLTSRVEDHIDNILSKIIPHQKELIDVTENLYSEFKCALYLYEENPGIHLDEKLLKRVADLNTRIDLDIYTNLNS